MENREQAEVDIHFYVNKKKDEKLLSYLQQLPRCGRSEFIKTTLRKAIEDKEINEKVEEAKEAEVAK
jgi:metal-responsive CopG/Arc/MetJ family transcriptional regulator